MGRSVARLEGSRFGSYPRTPPMFISTRVLTGNLFKQAAPGNVSTRVRFYRHVTQMNNL